MHFLPNCVRVVCIQNKAKRGRPSVCTFWLLRLGLWCLASVCTFSQSAAALYAYFLQTKRGCLVCTLFARCSFAFGVCLVYALFLFPCLLPRCPASVCTFLRNKKKKYKKERGKEWRFMYALYGGKTGRPSVCTLCREKRSPAAGIARRRAEWVSG